MAGLNAIPSSTSLIHRKNEDKEVNPMEKPDKKDDMSTWAIGGCLLMGLGVGFFFLKVSPMAFVGCILAGLGLGLVVAPIISKMK